MKKLMCVALILCLALSDIAMAAELVVLAVEPVVAAELPMVLVSEPRVVVLELRVVLVAVVGMAVTSVIRAAGDGVIAHIIPTHIWQVKDRVSAKCGMVVKQTQNSRCFH